MRRAEFEILKSRDRIDLLAPDFAVPTPEVVDPLVVKNTNDYNKQDGIHNGYEEYLDSFEEMMEKKEVVSYFQPIVAMNTCDTIGFEMLGRAFYKNLPSNPEQLFSIASAFGLEERLSRLFRLVGINEIKDMPSTHHLFINAHPSEMYNSNLLDSLFEIRTLVPDHPITLELSENSALSLNYLKELRLALYDLDIKLAYDDFGSGQSRLIELIEVPPDYLKFDIALIKNIHKSSKKLQHMVETLVNMVGNLGIYTVAEGIECKEEYEFCAELGFDYGQGFYFGRPTQLEHILLQ